MAKEGERPTAADKGKGKVDDVRELNGQKKDVKDEKAAADGKKDGDDEPQEGTCDAILNTSVSAPVQEFTSTWHRY
jgi:hypothetical protein